MSLIYGIDEAGRGPILGPIVVAVVGATPAGVEKLVQAGFKDSKGYGSGAAGKRKRAELAAWLEREAAPKSGHRWDAPASGIVAHFSSQSAEVVDQYVTNFTPGGLNKLERATATMLLLYLDAGVGTAGEPVIYADGASLFGPMVSAGWTNLIAVDKGESAHVTVAAASVLAKHYRDLAMEAIEAKYLDEFGVITGGGYLNPGTRKFLDAYAAKYGGLPPEARRSWGASKAAGKAAGMAGPTPAPPAAPPAPNNPPEDDGDGAGCGTACRGYCQLAGNGQWAVYTCSRKPDRTAQ